MSHAVNNPWVKKLLSRAETYSLQTVMKEILNVNEKVIVKLQETEWKEMDEPRPWAWTSTNRHAGESWTIG